MTELEINPQWRIPLDEFDFTYCRSSGPGGQNVNKVSSKATLRWAATRSAHWPPGARARFLERFAGRLTKDGDLLVTSQESRDQERNRARCLEKLQALLQAIATAPKLRRATRPSRGSKERRLKSKRSRSQVKNLRRAPPGAD